MTKEVFYNKWIDIFANNIPKKDIRKYVKSTGNYIWHIFSWKLLTENQYLIKEKAKEAYDRMDKKGALYIDWFNDEQTKEMMGDMNTANSLDDFTEIYVVGKDFKWTYIKTHECMCGPYFMISKYFYKKRFLAGLFSLVIYKKDKFLAKPAFFNSQYLL